MDENSEIVAKTPSIASSPSEKGISKAKGDALHTVSNASALTDEAIDMSSPDSQANSEKAVQDLAANPFMNGQIKTLDGDMASDEFAADAINYQVLLGKIDTLLAKLKLDA